MKGERRHELEHNALLNWLMDVGKTLQPYANLLVGAALAVAIVAIGWTLWSQRSGATSGQAWEDFQSALGRGSFVELENVAENYPGSPIAHLAMVVLGDLRLAEGCDELFRSRAAANEELRKAIDAYKTALDESADPVIDQRAAFGLARAYEAQGELDKAIIEYKKLTDSDGPYKEVARERVAALDDPDVRAFSDKFAQFDPKPAYSEPTVPPLDLDKLTPPPGDMPFPGLGSVSGEGKAATGEGAKATTPPIELPGDVAPSAETPVPAAPSTPATEAPTADEPKNEPAAP